MLETRFESLPDGKKLRVAREGKGLPLLLLHGYPDNLQIWSRVTPLLSPRFEVIAFDWPGMGYSEGWSGGVSPFHLADRLLKLIDYWKFDRVSLLAHDMGAHPALVFAARYPEKIHRLFVMNSLVFGEESTSWEIALLRKFQWNRLLLRNFPRPVFRRACRTSLSGSFRLSSDVARDFWDAFRKKEVRTHVARMCHAYQGTLSKLPQVYSEIRCPVAILWGERDKHFPLSQGVKLSQRIPGAVFSVIPGGEHWMVFEVPDRVAKEMSDKRGRT